MDTLINWRTLVDQGRAKDVGISWSEEELHAIYVLKISPDDVRRGVFTHERLAHASEQPLTKLTREQLLERVKAVGVSIADEGAMTRQELMRVISDAKTVS